MDAAVLAELIEMHVLAEQDGVVRLDTAVFLQDDIERIIKTIKPFADELAPRIAVCGKAFEGEPAEVTIFLAAIIGLVQGMGLSLSQKDPRIWEWKQYTGKYARSKVDLDQICEPVQTGKVPDGGGHP